MPEINGTSVNELAAVRAALADKLRANRGPLRAVALGDSIGNGDSDHQANVIGKNTFISMIQWLCAGKINFVRNACIPGDTTFGMMRRFDDEVLAYKPHVCFYLGGRNDINSDGTFKTGPISNTLDNDLSFMKACLSNDIMPVFMAIPPAGPAQPLNAAKTNEVNAAKKALCALYGV